MDWYSAAAIFGGAVIATGLRSLDDRRERRRRAKHSSPVAVPENDLAEPTHRLRAIDKRTLQGRTSRRG